MEKPKMKLLFTEHQIRQRAAEMASEICASYDDDKPIVCVCVLRGAVMFYTDLMKEIKEKDVIYDFITLSSYENAMYTSGRVKLVHDLRESVEGCHVLVVEDIVDSGCTISYLRKFFKSKNAADVRIACLLDKPFARKVEAYADHVAFTLSNDKYIVGYGLDSAQIYRNLNGVYELE